MNRKLFTFVFIIYVLIACLCLFMMYGCAIFGGAKGISVLPETPQQQLFQTLAKTNWLLTLTIIGVGAGFFAFLNGSSKGLQFMAACFVVICLIIGITRYSAWIAVIAMIGTVCLMLYSVLVKNKALKEVVKGVQVTRNIMRNRSTVGIMEVDAQLSNVQSKTTKAIVKTVKKAL